MLGSRRAFLSRTAPGKEDRTRFIPVTVYGDDAYDALRYGIMTPTRREILVASAPLVAPVWLADERWS